MCACFFGAVRSRRGREFYAIKWTSFGVHLVVGTVFRAAGNRVGTYIGCARLRRPKAADVTDSKATAGVLCSFASPETAWYSVTVLFSLLFFPQRTRRHPTAIEGIQGQIWKGRLFLGKAAPPGTLTASVSRLLQNIFHYKGRRALLFKLVWVCKYPDMI